MMAEPSGWRLVISKRIFTPTDEMLAPLRRRRDRGYEDEVTRAFDAFLVDPGMGPATYLSTSGRVLWDDDMWGIRGTLGDALTSIAVAARKTGVRALLGLAPPRPEGAADCVRCRATRGVSSPRGDGAVHHFVCFACGGLGWVSDALDLEASVVERVLRR